MKKIQELAQGLPTWENCGAGALLEHVLALCYKEGLTWDRVTAIAERVATEPSPSRERSAGHALVALARVANARGIDLNQEGLAALTREFAHG